jgi:hypothetical protein
MSLVKVQGNASGTGIFTIASPNSNTDRTLTLPDSSGTLQVSGAAISGTTGTFTGLLDISAAGAGQIQFPATQNASSNANTLDDYEEGTWTPALSASTTAPTVTYTYRSGVYRKIGSMVYVQFGININTRSGGSGEIVITGLPFTAIARGPYQEPANSLQGGRWTNSAYAGRMYWFINDNATNAFTRYADNNDTQPDISLVQGSTYFNGIMVYCASA